MKKKTKKYIKIITGTTLGLAALLFVVLVIHIAVMVKGRSPVVKSSVQMARVDFAQPLDSSAIAQIKHSTEAISGVRSSFYNTKSNILIYKYDNRMTSGDIIYKKAIKNLPFKSKRYTVSDKDIKEGCPVIDNDSFYGQLTSVVAKVIN